MTCGSCGRANRAAARFCGGCGKPLAPRCPACGNESEPDAQFCDACGASLVARPARVADDAVARKIVTIVFADLIGSTSLHERLDAESTRRLMDRYYRALHAAVEAHGGTVVKLLGDGVMAAFGVPRVAEDDAIRAVRAAVGMQHAFRELPGQTGAAVDIGLRVAVNTGEVVVSDDQHDVVGDPVNVAARLQQEARDGDVLIGESTRRLVSELVTLAPLGALSLKGRSETVAAYRVVSLDRPAGATTTPFVGRDDELRRVRSVYDLAVKARRAHLAVILGSPGLGKSRLTAEFARRLGPGTTVLTARCDAAGGATFAPLAEALRNFLRIDDGTIGDALRVAIEAAVPLDEPERAHIGTGVAALLTGTPATPEETFFVVRRLFAALAGAQPVLLVIDDLHCAEPLLLDLTEHLVQWGAGVPLLVLTAARPELHDTRASLAVAGGVVSDVVMLTGLDAGAATRLAANVVGASELPAAVAGRVLATSEGNPLFLAELVRMLVENGTLRQEGDRWVAAVDLAEIEVPPTIHALLAARIERLRPEERAVLERAAVIGRQFSRAAVAHLLPPELHVDFDAQLESLRRSELIEPDTGWFLGEPVLRFHHALIRDAAYRRLLKGTRAELHGRVAGWIESRVGEAGEHDEMIGWHLEQAHQHLREIGPIDENGRAFGERAARYLAAAGRRALARDDLAPAAGLLGRALDQLDSDDPARAALGLDWCEALLAAGDVGPAAGAVDELGRFRGDSDRLRAWHTCFAGQLAVLTDPQALRATADAVAAAAAELASAVDAAGEAKAHSVHALALARLGKIGACEAALDRALAAARRAHDRRRANAVLAGAPLAALWGPSPVTRASGRCLDVVRVLRITQGAPAVEAVALRCQAVLEALRGRTDAARRMIASSRRMVEELGISHRLLEADVFAGYIDLLEGDAVAAERCLRAAYDGLREHGLGIDAAQAAALLGRALLAQGRAEEAEALSHDSEALAGDDLKAAIAWRGVRAEALARRGEHASAVELARTAVDIAAATDALLDHADARLALAVALRAAGRPDEAGAEEAQAIELWEAKGATLLAERARRSDTRTGRRDRASDDRTEPAHPVRRRVRANAATASSQRLLDAIAARDTKAISALLGDGMVVVDHAMGVDYDRQGVLRSFRALLSARDPTFHSEPLATLGEPLALFRRSVSASGSTGEDGGASKKDTVVPLGIGVHEINGFTVLEVDTQGRQRRADVFAADRLGAAIARLYERYADLQPDGPARARAAATARAVAAQLGPFGLASMAASFAPAVEFVDHRTLGFGSMSGAQAVLQRLRSLLEVSADIATRAEDILALRSDALLVRWTNVGTERAGGGAYEQHFLMLFVFGSDGLVTRNELFDFDRDTEALARLDEVALSPDDIRMGLSSRATEPFERRVRANAATANAARLDAAIAARDVDALLTLLADGSEIVHHPTGAVYDKRGALSSWRALLKAQDVRFANEPLATLGDALALCRTTVSFGVLAEDDVAPFGAVRKDEIILIEVDARGQRTRAEFFATERLGDAIIRLYERYAQLVPDGPAHARALATAGSIATMLGPFDLDRAATALAAAVDLVDHRPAGFGCLHTADEVVRALATAFEVADDLVERCDEVIAVQPHAFLVGWTTSGRNRVGGGAFEWPHLRLCILGADGLFTRVETFPADQERQALVRFDELDAAYAERYAATEAASFRRTTLTRAFTQAFAARDWGTLATLLAPDLVVNDHRLLGWETLHGPAAYIQALKSLIDLAPDVRLRIDHVTMSGPRFLYVTTWVGTHEGGPFESPSVIVCELDGTGRIHRFDQYDLDHLEEARAQVDANAATECRGEGAE